MENTQSQRFCPEDRRCTFLHKYKISSGGGGGHGNKFHGQPSGLTIFAKIISEGKTKQTRLDDGIVVCLYLVQQKPYQHMFKQKYHKKWAKFLDSESSWRDLMFFLSTFCLELHLITISTCTYNYSTCRPISPPTFTSGLCLT